MKKIKDDSIKLEEGAEHIPAVPFNEEIEKQKRENRKKAEELRKKTGASIQLIITESGEKKKASELNFDEQILEIARCTKDPIYFIETYLTIFDQTQGDGGMIVPFKLFEDQKKLVNAYQEFRFNVANKYRQAGISTTTCAYIAWYVMFNNNRNVAIIADKLETARDELMRDVVDFIESCPSWLQPEPIYKNTMKHKHYDNDSELRAFSSKGLRGPTPTLLFWDETAWTERGYEFWTAARPTLQTGGRAIFVSTPNGLDPVFYSTFNNAINKKNNFNPIELWWYNDPRYTRDEITQEFDLQWVKNKGKKNEIRIDDEHWDAKKRKSLIKDGFEPTSSWFEKQIMDYNGDMKKLSQEILCSFLGSGDNFIAEEYLKEIEEEQIATPIKQEYIDNEFWIWEDPIPGEEYVMTLDASAGHGEDFSTINIYKLHELIDEKVVNKNGKSVKKKIKRMQMEQVAEYYNKLRPQQLGELAYQYGKIYYDAYAIVDVTGGYGTQAIEKLLELGYVNVHYSEIAHKPTRDMLAGYIKVGVKILPDGTMSKVDLVPGFLIGQNRGSVLTEFQRAIHLKEIVMHSLRLLNELKTFVNVPGTRVADHKRSFHDDSIMPTACATYVVNYQMTSFKNSISKTKKMLDSMLILGNKDVIIKNKDKKNTIGKVEKKNDELNSRSPNFRVGKTSPYGANSWLFSGLKK